MPASKFIIKSVLKSSLTLSIFFPDYTWHKLYPSLSTNIFVCRADQLEINPFDQPTNHNKNIFILHLTIFWRNLLVSLSPNHSLNWMLIIRDLYMTTIAQILNIKPIGSKNVTISKQVTTCHPLSDDTPSIWAKSRCPIERSPSIFAKSSEGKVSLEFFEKKSLEVKAYSGNTTKPMTGDLMLVINL